MKKFALVLILLLLSFSLTACDPGEISLKFDEISDGIVAVELIEYQNDGQRHFVSWIPDHSGKLVPFEPQNMTVVEVLSEDKISAFLEDLSAVSFLHKYYAYNSPKGICIRLVYSDYFVILSCNYPAFSGYVGSYDNSGEIIDFIGCFTSSQDFEHLVSTYFDFTLE